MGRANRACDYRFKPLLEKSGTREDPSRIVVVSSTAGINVPHVGENGTIMYSVSKAAAHVWLPPLYYLLY